MNISIDGPYRDFTRKRRWKRRLDIALVVLILAAIILFIAVSARSVQRHTVADRWDHTWVSKKEAQRIMRYHGVGALMITDEDVSILRDGKWIVVFNRAGKEGGC